MWCVEHQRRGVRRTACVALLGWLFALAAGVANACLLPTSAARTTTASSEPQPAVVGPSTQTAHDDHANHDGGSGTPHDGRANCLKFCADESSTLAKDGGKSFDFSQLAIVEFFLKPRLDDVGAAHAAYRLAAPPARPGPSLVIRLLRLTT